MARSSSKSKETIIICEDLGINQTRQVGIGLHGDTGRSHFPFGYEEPIQPNVCVRYVIPQFGIKSDGITTFPDIRFCNIKYFLIEYRFNKCFMPNDDNVEVTIPNTKLMTNRKMLYVWEQTGIILKPLKPKRWRGWDKNNVMPPRSLEFDFFVSFSSWWSIDTILI